jgi:hypothetical protein
MIVGEKGREMDNFEARHMIEALRSGVPSRTVGQCFSSARPRITGEIASALDTAARAGGGNNGMIITGKYGEGKTHLLNTVFNMAHERNMVVSFVSLSKETPFDKLHFVYPKVVQATYLPKRLQPGFAHLFETMSPKSPVAAELSEYVLRNLETDKLYYLLKSYLGTEEIEEKFTLLADLEGDFVSAAALKKIYKRIFSEKVVFNKSFAKTKHAGDYFSFLSRMFRAMGFAGWVILFDEAELIGRMGKKARLNAYNNIAKFLFPQNSGNRLESTYCLFAFNASFVPDVIESKHEFENLDAAEHFTDEEKANVKSVLNALSSAPQLAPLSEKEVRTVIEKIAELHAKAYGWKPQIDADSVFAVAMKHGALLRTRIRTAVELLDQYYQYGEAGEITVNALGQVSFTGEEDDVAVSLDALMGEG